MCFDSNVPNLFVIGVPKAGTTSLLRWLGDHPQIGRSYENELRFLMDEDDPLCRTDGYTAEGLAGYAQFYAQNLRQDRIKYLLDVSPQYYYQKTAQSVIGSIPDSQVIFVLRRPSARIYSLYNYAKNNKAALNADMGFTEFVDEIRRAEQSKALRNRPMLQYAIDHSKYVSFIRQWQSIVGPDRLNILLFENLVSDPVTTLVNVAKKLDVDDTFYEDYDFPVQNESYTLRYRGLHKLVHRSRKNLPGWIRRSLKPAYMYFNTRKTDRKIPAADQRLLRQLDAEFHDSEIELAEVLGCSKPLWSQNSDNGYRR